MVGVIDRVKRKGLRIFGGKRPKLDADSRPRVLFVSHEATRTGAPLIILNVLRHFAQHADVQLETILHNGGHLVDEFAAHSRINCLNMARKTSEELSRRIKKIAIRNRQSLPALAICNSMETRFIAFELAKRGIPIIFLVHELPSSYTAADYQRVFDISSRIVFPINAVKQETATMIHVPEEKSLVLPQGLLNVEFGKTIDRQTARRQIRAELGIPEDAEIVLGCGTLDLRKGIDHFAAIAHEMVHHHPASRCTHFVWVGEGPRWTHSPFHYVSLDLKKTNTQSFVHFVGEREDVEPFFFGSDVFLLTSRVDPFPCVIHEAMAAQLPIITFDQSGGAAEAVENGAGVVVPYADYRRAAQMIDLLCTQASLRDSIQKKSLERVATDYCFADYANRLLREAETVSKTTLRTGSSYLPFAA